MSFKIGDLTLHRNTNEDFYHEFENAHDQPVMMVEEIQINSKTEYRIEDGVAKSKKHEQNCKCIWYNHKNGEFKEDWFKSKYLIKLGDGESNLIPSNSKKDHLHILKNEIGTVVRLINHDLESDKHLKASVIDKGAKNINYRKLERENQFCAPQMTIIDVKTNGRNKDIYDKKSGIKTKAASEYLVKCKWFNIAGNKYSEKYLPYQLLIKNTPIEKETLENIKDAIEQAKYIKAPNNKGLYEPIHVLNNGGNLQLLAHNYLINKDELVNLNQIKDFEVLHDFAIRNAPVIEESKGKHDVFSIIDLLNKYEKSYSTTILRFAYENLLGEFSYQSIKSAVKFDLDGEVDDAEFYLKGIEIKSDKEKYYRLDRIKFMWILNYES